MLRDAQQLLQAAQASVVPPAPCSDFVEMFTTPCCFHTQRAALKDTQQLLQAAQALMEPPAPGTDANTALYTQLMTVIKHFLCTQ